jgi:hypothetical protein
MKSSEVPLHVSSLDAFLIWTSAWISGGFGRARDRMGFPFENGAGWSWRGRWVEDGALLLRLMDFLRCRAFFSMTSQGAIYRRSFQDISLSSSEVMREISCALDLDEEVRDV